MSFSEITNLPLKPIRNPEDVLLVPEPPGEQKHWRDTATSFFGGGWISRSKSALLTTSRSSTRLENNIPPKLGKCSRSKSTPLPVVLGKSQGFIQPPKASIRENSKNYEEEVEEREIKTLLTSDIGLAGSKNTTPEKSELDVDSLKWQPGSTLYQTSSVLPSTLAPEVLASESSSASLSNEGNTFVPKPVLQKFASIKDDHESNSSSQKSIITEDTVVTGYLTKTESVTRVLFPDNHTLNQYKDGSTSDSSYEEVEKTQKLVCHTTNSLPNSSSSVKDTRENSFELIQSDLSTPPHMRSKFSDFQSTKCIATTNLKSTTLLDEPKSGVVVDNRLVLSPNFVELKIEGASIHSFSSPPKVNEGISKQSSKSCDNLPGEPETVLNVNTLETAQKRKSECNDFKLSGIPTPFQTESNTFSNLHSENTIPRDEGISSCSLLEYIVDPSQVSNITSSSPQVLSEDSQQISSKTLSSQVLNVGLQRPHDNSTTVKAINLSLSGRSTEEDTEKECNVKNKECLHKLDKLIEEMVITANKNLGPGEEKEAGNGVNSFLSTNPFANCTASKSTNPFASSSAPSNDTDPSSGKNQMENSDMQSSTCEIGRVGDCTLKTSTTGASKLLPPNGDKVWNLNECRLKTKATKNADESINKILVGNTACNVDNLG